MLSRLIELYSNQKYAELERGCRELLAKHPDNAHGWHLAAANAMQLNQLEDALEYVNKALLLLPEEVIFLNTRGSICRRMGQIQEAVNSYLRALSLDPAQLDALYNLANLYRDADENERAIEAYLQVLASNAGHHPARINLAFLYRAQNRPEAAEHEFRSLMALGGGSLEAFFGLGQVLLDQQRHAEAEACFRQLLQASPGHPDATFYLGNALAAQGKILEAESCYRYSQEKVPDFYRGWNNLGNNLRDQGRHDEAVACYRKAIALNPSYMHGHSNLLFNMNCIERDGKQLFAEHRLWDEQHARALLQHYQFNHDRSPDRQLRIGYVSADFRNHSVAFFIEGVLRHHDAGSVHVTCYSNLLKPDARTATIRGLADAWREIGQLSDDEVAKMIIDDAIDILIDLSGHSRHHRLLVFARKPAPVQVTYLGYPATTGMQAMDYRITDAIADPEYTDAFHQEAPVRLSRCFIAYSPDESSPDVSSPPVEEAGFIRFISLNHLSKIGEDVVRLWSRLLHAVPNSRLTLKHFSFSDGGIRESYIKRFQDHGIAAQRIETFAWASSAEMHLRYYQRADIALDSFPYNGATTTCEALWMGVPVVALAGSLHAGRVGASLLNSVGLTEMVAEDEDAYVEIATELALDRWRLRQLRAGLRTRMKDSPLCDVQGLARALEAEYRNMWRRWCDESTAA